VALGQGHNYHRQHCCAEVLTPTGVIVLKWLTINPCHTHSFHSVDMKIGEHDFVRPHTNPAKFGPFWINGRGPARGWNIRVVWLFLFFSCLTRSRTKSGEPDEHKWLQNANVCEVVPLDVKVFNNYDFVVFYPQTLKLEVMAGFPMQITMLNISKTV